MGKKTKTNSWKNFFLFIWEFFTRISIEKKC